MSVINVKQELKCPFTERSVKEAFGEEVSLFLHCHLRGYDRTGNGKQLDAEYYDKYGAPVKKNESWTEGYHVIEKKLGEHFDICDNKIIRFPLVAGMAGGAHLYKDFHTDDPWNWTGWVPTQKEWLCEGELFSNRYFLAIRGNEIQNNLWDYHPKNVGEGDEIDEMEYSQVEPNDKYLGGYFFQDNEFARYLHIIALKSHTENPDRYNYIVHPLAYRASLDKIPDNSVDGMQWSIINIAQENHFGEGKDWGEKVHGLEIYNDFTYYYSYMPDEEYDTVYNGQIVPGEWYAYWFNTYPLEYAEFLLESALARGVYLYTQCANDAFYERAQSNIPKSHVETQILLSDPKGFLVYNYMKRFQNASVSTDFPKLKTELKMEGENADDPKLGKVMTFLAERPYRYDTVFGYTTLIDTKKELRKTVFEQNISGAGLNKAELQALEFLREGRFYSSTGVYHLFCYESDTPAIPYEIEGQLDKERLCYEITEEMQLIFTFAKCTTPNAALVWRYSIMITKDEPKAVETAHGYFKLSDSKKTVLDLSQSYEKNNVKWLYFMAINPDNPMRRAWFCAVKGPAFGNPQCNEDEFCESRPVPQHKVFSTTTFYGNIIQSDHDIQLFCIDSSQLDFYFPAVEEKEEDNIYAYFMQAYPLQQNVCLPETNRSSTQLPPRYLQNVHGYFTLKKTYPTRLKLSQSWDKTSVTTVYFYQINTAGQPMDLSHVIPVPYCA